MISLPLETDQAHCYDAAGEKVSCTGSGQDAETYQGGLIRKDRFDIQGKAVFDRLTGLSWTKNASPAEFPLTWAEAFEAVKQLGESGYGGIQGWRLPTRRELFSLMSHQHVNPALPAGHPFTDVFSGYYWTASMCARLKDQAWYVHLGGGRIYRGMRYGSYMVWPVSGPEEAAAGPSNRFAVYDRTILDRLTKRMWLQPVKEMLWPMEWEKALGLIREFNDAGIDGYADWRLPNIRELESLVDLNRHSPALAPGGFPGALAEGYWSSTTSLYETRYAWVLYPRDGAVGVGFKRLPEFCALAVRRPD